MTLPAGECSRCRKPLSSPKHKRCDDCREYERKRNRRRYRQRYEAGTCRSCGAPDPVTPPPCAICLPCWAKKMSRKHFHTNRFGANVIKMLKYQEYKCAISGEALVPGLNASLDHIIPRAKGGPNTIENMQIVTREYNSRKFTRYPYENGYKSEPIGFNSPPPEEMGPPLSYGDEE